MEIPKTLKIGGHQYTVDCSQDLDGLYGEQDPKTNTIRISSTLAPSQQAVALFHEILHAINSEFEHDDYAHALLESLSQQLYQVFADNNLLR